MLILKKKLFIKKKIKLKDTGGSGNVAHVVDELLKKKVKLNNGRLINFNDFKMLACFEKFMNRRTKNISACGIKK
jgi:hypothetical protein